MASAVTAAPIQVQLIRVLIAPRCKTTWPASAGFSDGKIIS